MSFIRISPEMLEKLNNYELSDDQKSLINNFKETRHVADQFKAPESYYVNKKYRELAKELKNIKENPSKVKIKKERKISIKIQPRFTSTTVFTGNNKSPRQYRK